MQKPNYTVIRSQWIYLHVTICFYVLFIFSVFLCASQFHSFVAHAVFQLGAISPLCRANFFPHLVCALFRCLVYIEFDALLWSTRRAVAFQFAFGGFFMLILSRTCTICSFYTLIGRRRNFFPYIYRLNWSLNGGACAQQFMCEMGEWHARARLHAIFDKYYNSPS